MDTTEGETIRAKIRAEEEAKARAKSKSLERGFFFSPWDDVWNKEIVQKGQCNGAFNAVRREQGYADSVPIYKDILKDILKQSMSESEQMKSASNARNGPNRSKKDSGADKAKVKNRVLRHCSTSPSSKSSKSSSQRNKSVAASQSSRNSVGSSLSGSSKASATSQSMRSATSQSMLYPDFGGGFPSTRAHLIPNIKTSGCFKYCHVICQTVVGFRCNDVARSERIANKLAESDYNFLRACHNHGKYFDLTPCWILVPACSLDSIRNWKPCDVYPVLAVASTAGDTNVEEAYKMMCHYAYNDEDFGDAAGILKRSKCKKPEFDLATENLRQMTLAMAETLVGKGFKPRPDQSLHNHQLDDEDRMLIIEKLKIKTQANEGDEKSGGEEIGTSRRNLRRADYDKVQFEETAKSLKSGIVLPQAKPGLDFDRVELLQFEVDPCNLDLYPDPMLLLIKAAVNWSWWCNQKLLPACGRANEEEEEDEEEQLAVPSTPIPAVVEFKPVPVTPDEDASV